MAKQREDDGEGWAAAFEEEDSFNPRAFSQPRSDARGVQESLDSEHFTNPFYDEKNPFLGQNYN
jgi:hypothetical protein